MRKKRRYKFLEWLDITAEFVLELLPLLLRGLLKLAKHIFD